MFTALIVIATFGFSDPSGEIRAPSAAASTSFRTDPRRSFPGFWKQYRKAVANLDKAALARMTNFPFVTRWGNDDESDPRVDHDRASFVRIVEPLLLRPEPNQSSPMQEVIGQTEAIDAEDAADGHVLIEHFEFLYLRGAWRWTTAFVENVNVVTPMARVVEIRPTSPLFAELGTVVCDHLKLDRDVRVTRMRRGGDWIHLTGSESGPGGRRIQALLKLTGSDSKGKRIWSVSEAQIANDSADWKAILARHPDVPTDLVPNSTKDAQK